MPYLILDPVDGYPARMVDFLARAGLDGVAVLTSAHAEHAWRSGWGRRLAHGVAASYRTADHPNLGALAERLTADWPQGFAGIIPWDERSIVAGAELGELLGLGWNPRAVIERCRDKHRMKAWLRDHGEVRVNASAVVRDAPQALAFQRRLDAWPVVVKPTAGAGSRDVLFPAAPEDLLRCCQQVLESGAGEVLLEEYVAGPELAVNGLVDRGGDLLVTDVWRYDRRQSHGVPNLYFQTIKVNTDDVLFRPLMRYAAQVVEALGLRRAPIHMEVKVDGDGPCLIEVGARLAGGNQPLLASELHGRSLFELAACHYLEELPLSVGEIDYQRYDARQARIVSGVQSVALTALRAIHGTEAVESLPSFWAFGFLRPVGAPVPVTRDLTTKAWELYLIHPDAGQIARDASAARTLLRYV